MIIYFVDNKMGGVSSLNFNLAANALDKKEDQWVIHIDETDPPWTKANIQYPVNRELYFNFSREDNTYYLLKKLRALVPDKEGALVLNYEIEMAMLDHYKVKQTVYQLIHDDYNVSLAQKYGHIVDVFICHNLFIYDKLTALLPGREKHIFYLPHGVKIPSKFREPVKETKLIRLLFLGRMAFSKGITDLPLINDLLRAEGIKFEWTCIGGGPDLEMLKSAWNPADKVSFLNPASNEEVIEASSQADVFVLPTKFEGSPVSLLETMSVGLVPVITDLEGGIKDVVTDEIGFRIKKDNNAGFANAIIKLYNDHNLLNTLSNNCRNKIAGQYDVKRTAARYHELFLRYREFYAEKKIQKKKVGARLDHPFISQGITRLARSIQKKFKT